MHCHTLASAHAYSTIQEMAAAARKRGLMAIAVTDHGITMEDAPHPWYFQNQKVLPRVIEGVNVLKGMEANILDGDGNLDIREEALRGLEWVVASIHYGVPENDKEACTNAWFQVAKKDFVRVIGHSGTLKYPYDYEPVIKEFGARGKLVEINVGTFYNDRRTSIPNCMKILQLCKKHSVPVIVDSDSHFSGGLGKFAPALRLLEEAEFPEELVINAEERRFRNYVWKYCGIHLSATYLNLRNGEKIVARKKAL